MGIKQEEWKDVVGFDGRYQVSNLGRVKSFSSVTRKETILTGNISCYGYYRVALSKNKISKFFYIHRLVAMHFLELPEIVEEVNHIDLCKTNNLATNLEFVSHQNNIKHAQKHGLFDPFINPKRGMKLTAVMVNEIRMDNASGMNNVAIGKKFGVHNTTVSKIIRNDRWKVTKQMTGHKGIK